MSNRHSSSDETLVADDRRVKDAERKADIYAKEVYILKSEKASLEAQLRAVKGERDEALRDKRDRDRIINDLKAELQLAERTKHLSVNDDYSWSPEPRSRASRRPAGVRFENDLPLGGSSYRTGASDGGYHSIPVRTTRLH